ncbi:hypothetical protein KCU95_g62, partial [Aureobasidium melanogenum]
MSFLTLVTSSEFLLSFERYCDVVEPGFTPVYASVMSYLELFPSFRIPHPHNLARHLEYDEGGNADILMFADLDYSHLEVCEDVTN